jgi:hypothetical protein
MDLESVSIPPTVWSDRTLSSGLDVSPLAGCEASLSGSGHSDQSAFRILEMAHNEPVR